MVFICLIRECDSAVLMMSFFFQAEDGIRDYKVDWSSDVCSSDLKETLKRDLGLDNATTDSQLVSLIASDEFDGGEPFTPVIDPIDIEGMQPFESAVGQEDDPNGSIIDFLRLEESRVGKECRYRVWRIECDKNGGQR